MALSPITSVLESAQLNSVKAATQDSENQNENVVSFGDYLKNALNTVNQLQIDSQQAGIDFAAGKTDNIHEVMIAGQKADIAIQLTMQIRNKVMDAYSEIMRMQL